MKDLREGDTLVDETGAVIGISHHQAPIQVAGEGLVPESLRKVTIRYLSEDGAALVAGVGALGGADQPAPAEYDPQAPERYHFIAHKVMFNAHVVPLQRCVMGLPVVGEGLAVRFRVREAATHILGARRGRGGVLDVATVSREKAAAVLADPMALLLRACGKELASELASWKVGDASLSVGRAAERRGAEVGDEAAKPWAALPELPKDLAAGRYAVCVEITLTKGGKGAKFPFRVRVAVDAEAVLSLERMSSGATIKADLWTWDPITRGKCPSSGPGRLSFTSSGADLDPHLQTIDVTTVGPMLESARAKAVATSNPTLTPPTGLIYADDVRTEASAHEHGFYQVDEALSQLDDLGFGAAAYLPAQVLGGRWPIDVRGLGSVYTGEVGWIIGAGGKCADTIAFGSPGVQTLVPPEPAVNGSLDRRIVYHEVFGHVTLLNHIGTLTLPFCHSPGDAFAAVYGDVDCPDRAMFETFPFSAPAAAGVAYAAGTLARRHDRVPSPGKDWGWGDPTLLVAPDYTQEQKLSSTIFRLYRALGGDDLSPTRRRIAARTTAWLTLQAIATLTPGTAPANAEAFADDLMAADLVDWTTQGWFGGAFNKVVRWAFEKQGAYQNTAFPAYDAPGSPPAVDLHLTPARGGEYTYTTAWRSSAIWNRQAADGLTTHQAPVPGVKNHLYVRVANRGTTGVTKAAVTAWVRKLGVGTTWPGSFTQVGGTLLTPTIPANNAGSVVVGPFTWVPTSLWNHALLGVVDHADDPANTQHFSAMESIEVSRLVPFDNNLAYRAVAFFKLVVGQKGWYLPYLLAYEVVNSAITKVAVRIEHRARFAGYPWSAVLSRRLNLVAEQFSLAAGATVQRTLPLTPASLIPAYRTLKRRALVIDTEVWIDGLFVGGIEWRGTT